MLLSHIVSPITPRLRGGAVSRWRWRTCFVSIKSQGLLVSKGTMVDATLIHAPSSTKNQEQARDPEMRQTKQGKQWYFDMKVHVGADVDSGAVYTTFEVTAANEVDINVLPSYCGRKTRLSWASQKKRNRKHSSIRARVEHVFRVIKRQFGFTRTRYRGLMKNAVQVNMLMGLVNLYLLRKRLLLT